MNLLKFILAIVPFPLFAQQSYFEACSHLHPIEGQWKVFMEEMTVTPSGVSFQRIDREGSFDIRSIGREKEKFSASGGAGWGFFGVLQNMTFTLLDGKEIVGTGGFEGWNFKDTIWGLVTDDLIFHVFSNHYRESGDDLPEGATRIHRRYTFVKKFPLTELQEAYTYIPARGEVGMGTCFAVSNQGHIVTNHHVVEGGNYYHVRGLQGQRWRAKLIFSDSANDIAVLQVTDTSFTNRLTIPFRCTGHSPKNQGLLMVIGYPLAYLSGGLPKSAMGVFYQDNGGGRFNCYLLTNPGNSGGPILGANSELIGVVRAGMLQFAEAVSAERLLELLDAHGIPHVLRDPPMDMSTGKSFVVYPIDVEHLYTSR